MTQTIETFGDPGRIQKALDNNMCPRCLTHMNDPSHCFVCNLSIDEKRAEPERLWEDPTC